jgi:hypothetical protein
MEDDRFEQRLNLAAQVAAHAARRRAAPADGLWPPGVKTLSEVENGHHGRRASARVIAGMGTAPTEAVSCSTHWTAVNMWPPRLG